MSKKSIAEIFIEEAIKTESCNFTEIAERLSDKRTIRLLHAGLGLSTEANEFLDALKKWIFYGKELDLVNLAEEQGDSFWYHAIAANELGKSFEEIQVAVIQKLRKRYHEKNFSSEAAINRNLEEERNELEKTIDLATGFEMGASKLAEVILQEGIPNRQKTGAPIHYSASGLQTACNLQVSSSNHTSFVSKVTCRDCLLTISDIDHELTKNVVDKIKMEIVDDDDFMNSEGGIKYK